jgi:23S rRNA pseudouridine2604 synthase
VTVNRDIDDDFIHTLSNGVPILEQVTRKCKVEKLDDEKFRIILTQGLNRQIRRMVDFTGLRVRSLKRVRIMNVKLDISPGKWRHLTEDELTEIYRLSADSEKTTD